METIDEISAEVDEQFGYIADRSYQDRAHEYLERRGIPRTVRDTAVQCTVRDLVDRAYRCGLSEAEGLTVDNAREYAMALAGMAANLYEQSRRLIEMDEEEQ